MKFRSISSLAASALALMLLGSNALAIDYSKFTAEALMMMRESVAEADRAAYRQAFVDALSRMNPEARKEFQNKAMTRMMQMAPEERQAMIADLSRHMQAMDPAQIEALKKQFIAQSANTASAAGMPPRMPSQMAPNVIRGTAQRMPNRPVPQYPQQRQMPAANYAAPSYPQYPAAPQGGYGSPYGGMPYGYAGQQAYRPYPNPYYSPYGYR